MKNQRHDGHAPSPRPLVGVCSGARYWQAFGAPSTATIITIWSSGPGHWSLRSTIGYAAKLTVVNDRFQKAE
jgi:hypothetical protein